MEEEQGWWKRHLDWLHQKDKKYPVRAQKFLQFALVPLFLFLGLHLFFRELQGTAPQNAPQMAANVWHDALPCLFFAVFLQLRCLAMRHAAGKPADPRYAALRVAIYVCSILLLAVILPVLIAPLTGK